MAICIANIKKQKALDFSKALYPSGRLLRTFRRLFEGVGADCRRTKVMWNDISR